MKALAVVVTAMCLILTQLNALAAPDDLQDRRQERGRSDERQDRRDCRRDEGLVGEDKRECKREEVRDGARGNRDERFDDDDDEGSADD
jgi:hypothetical protein